MAVSLKMKVALSGSSVIRKMFNEGTRLKKQFGADNVYDFSLGNPNVPPPIEFTKAVKAIMEEDIPFKHAYMTNSGYVETREFVSDYVSKEQKTILNRDNIVMTCGAGAALNLVFQSILNYGDNVVVSIPNFVVYKTYVENYGGKLRTAQCKDDFNLDIEAIEDSIDVKTAAILINSPNNPSGVIYPESVIKTLCRMLERKSAEIGREIYLISDEPYRQIIYDDVQVPPIFSNYKNSIIVSSYSKTLSIPGERIGWVAVHPEADDSNLLIQAITMATTGLGFTNAPALMQRAIVAVKGKTVDPEIYKAKRDLFAKPLKEMGYDFILPKGTFYLFIKAPGGDDIEFVQLLQNEHILVVPGSGFNMPGYFRISYCVDDKVITGSLPGFKNAIEKIFSKVS